MTVYTQDGTSEPGVAYSEDVSLFEVVRHLAHAASDAGPMAEQVYRRAVLVVEDDQGRIGTHGFGVMRVEDISRFLGSAAARADSSTPWGTADG